MWTQDNEAMPKTITPAIKIANQKPLQNIGVNETFTAGDFPVTVKEVTGSNGVYTGWGYITVPYLGDTKIRVNFKNITINTAYQLIKGVVETSYDPNESEIADVGNLVKGISELFKKWDVLEEQKANGTISETDFNKQWKDVYNEITSINNNYKERTNYDDFPEEIKKPLSSLDKTIKELENTNFNTPSTEVAKNAETLKDTYEKVENYAKSVTLLDIDGLKDNQNNKLTISDYGRVYNNSGELQETKSGDYIVILLNKKPYKLSQLDYTKAGTLKAVEKIIKKEAEFLGFKGKFGLEAIKNEETGAYIGTRDKTVMVSINVIKSKERNLDNVYNLRNVLEHEADTKFGHISEKIIKDDYKFKDHFKVYLEQSKTENFKKSNNQNKFSVAYNFINRVFNSQFKREITSTEATEYLKRFNDDNVGRVNIKVGLVMNNYAEFVITINGEKYEKNYEDIAFPWN